MQTRSLFSVNTNQTGFKDLKNNGFPTQTNELNQIHEFFYRILPTFSKQCPYLAKIFYLQLILRQNILIFTQDRVDARDIWLYLSRVLDLKKPEIYVVDDKINVQELLLTKNQYQRIMLYDVSKMTNQIINKIYNSQVQISLLGIQNPSINVGQHVSDLFSIMISYSSQQQASHLVDTYNQSLKAETAKNFDKKMFNQCVKLNFEVVLQQTQQEGFLKAFLQLFQKRLDKVKIKISQSRWKKMLRILKFVGVNKQEGVFKKMSLGDFVLSPDLLASSVTQIKSITQVLFQTMEQFIPYYGCQKFEKSVKNHFWFSNNHSIFAKKLIDQIKTSTISFFYPCVKFPDTAFIKISPQDLTLNYQIRGYQKKLMSDHHYQIEPQRKYTLSLEIRSDSKMVVHLGISCYDKLKNIILPVQVCRRQKTEVIYQRLQSDRIYVKNINNLSNWANNNDNFAYERAIGIYINGQTDDLIPISQVLYNSKEPYSKNNRPYEAVNITNKQKDEGEIIMSQETRQWFVNFRHLLQKHKTVLINHYEGGVGCVGQSLTVEPSNQWKHVEISYQNCAFENTGRNFFPQTKYIRIAVMINYNFGYPNFQIPNKGAQFGFRNITFKKDQ